MTKRIVISLIVAIIAMAGTVLIKERRFPDFAQVVEAAQPKAPELIGTDDDWINAPSGMPLHLYGRDGVFAIDPLAPGKHPIVLVDFWDYTCVNCLRTLPYVEDWARRYCSSGLVVIGIHSPEFAFAHEAANVRRAVKRLGIEYPVLIDSSYDNWNAFDNDSWPMDYILDSRGHIVETHAGEGGYGDTENELRRLLLAANPGEALPPAYGDHEAAMPGDAYDMTAELYAGSNRGVLQDPEGFGNGEPMDYAAIAPEDWSDGELVVGGTWLFTGEYAQHVGLSPRDYIGVRYHARDIVAVIKPESAQPLAVVVMQDGRPVVKSDAGADIRYTPSGKSYLLIDSPREYQITHNAVFGTHTLALYPASDKFRLYSFCFSPT